MTPKPLSGKTRQRFFCARQQSRPPPCWPPCGPVCEVFPQGGERTRPNPQKSPQRPKTRPMEKGPVQGGREGVKNKQVKGPGSPTGVPCRVTSPGRAERDRIFPRRQFPRFPGSVWRPWGHGRGQKSKISRWQAIFPGVTAGVNERMRDCGRRKRRKTKIPPLDLSLPFGGSGFSLQNGQLFQQD